MIRLQVEAHVGAVTNPEAAREAGYAVAIVARTHPQPASAPGQGSSISLGRSRMWRQGSFIDACFYVIGGGLYVIEASFYEFSRHRRVCAGHSVPSVSRRGPQETRERPKEVQCVSATPWGVLCALEALWRVTGVSGVYAWRRRQCQRTLWTVRPRAGSHLLRSSLVCRHHHE